MFCYGVELNSRRDEGIVLHGIDCTGIGIHWQNKHLMDFVHLINEVISTSSSILGLADMFLCCSVPLILIIDDWISITD